MKKKVIVAVIVLVIILIAVFIVLRFTMKTISMEQAQVIALEYTDVSLNDAQFTKVKQDDFKYHIEFVTSDAMYECEISSLSGEVLEFEKKIKNTAGSENAPLENLSNDSNKLKLDTNEIAKAAYDYAGVKSQDVFDFKSEIDDGLYEIEFKTSDYKYECKVSPFGEVTEFKKENR